MCHLRDASWSEAYNSALALEEADLAAEDALAEACEAAEDIALAVFPPLLDASLLALDAADEATEEMLDADELAAAAAELMLDLALPEARPTWFRAQS